MKIPACQPNRTLAVTIEDRTGSSIPPTFHRDPALRQAAPASACRDLVPRKWRPGDIFQTGRKMGRETPTDVC